MPASDERLDRMERRLDGVGQHLDGLTGEVRHLTGRVDTLTGRVDTMGGTLHRLQVLVEDNAQQLRLIADVQAHHGALLERMAKDLEPLRQLPALMDVVRRPERRITALEGQSGRDA